MINAFYTAGSGLISQQMALNACADNLANANTSGYKAQSVGFSDLLYSNLFTADGAAPQNLRQGHGVRVSATGYNFAPGGLENTGRYLDFSVLGDGFFAVMSRNGEIRYTRCGNFTLSNEQGGPYLTTSSGEYVLSAAGTRIKVDTENLEALVSQIGVFGFANPYGLVPVGNSSYVASPAAGAATPVQTPEIRQGFLESSNVDLSYEMAKMIMAQRGFQFSAKMMQIADEIEQMTNNLRQ